jgi:hypothetical protein
MQLGWWVKQLQEESARRNVSAVVGYRSTSNVCFDLLVIAWECARVLTQFDW